MACLEFAVVDGGICGGVGGQIGGVRIGSDSCQSVSQRSDTEQLERDIRTRAVDPVTHGVIFGTGIC